jgi:hypothetical protein
MGFNLILSVVYLEILGAMGWPVTLHAGWLLARDAYVARCLPRE